MPRKLTNLIKRSSSLIIIFIGIITFSCSIPSEKKIATVNNHSINLSDFQKRYSEFLLSTGVKDNIVARKSILNNMINEIVLYYYDDNENVFNRKDYKTEQRWAENEVILAYLKDREIYSKITVSDAELRTAYFRANSAVSARHLFAKTEEEANNLYELLQAGASFEELARQVFTDSLLQNNGGNIGYFSWGDMDPEFENAAFNLKIGEISKPVQTAQGFSIIRVDDRKDNPLLTEYDFAKRKNELSRTLRINKKKPYEKKFIQDKFDSKKLKFNDGLLEKILTYNLLSNTSTEETDIKDICVSYDDIKLTVSEAAQLVTQIPTFHRNKIKTIGTLKRAIEGMLIQKVLLNYAHDLGYDDSEEVRKVQLQKKMNIYLKYKMNEIAGNAVVSDSLALAYYEDSIPMFSEPRMMNVSEIITESKNRADELIKMLNSGSSFKELASKYSIRKWSAENDGKIGLSPIEQFGFLKDEFWNAEVGKILGPFPIKDKYGIFKVLEKVDSKPIPFEKIKDKVKQRTKIDLKNRFVLEYLIQKRDSVKIWTNEEQLRFSFSNK